MRESHSGILLPLAVVASALVWLAAAPAAFALSEREPNDTRREAGASLLRGQTWEGTIGTENDEDLWAVNVGRGTTQVTIDFQNTTPRGDTPWYLFDFTHAIPFGFMDHRSCCNARMKVKHGEQGRLAYSLRGPKRFYFVIDAPTYGESPSYRFTVHANRSLLRSSR